MAPLPAARWHHTTWNRVCPGSLNRQMAAVCFGNFTQASTTLVTTTTSTFREIPHPHMTLKTKIARRNCDR